MSRGFGGGFGVGRFGGSSFSSMHMHPVSDACFTPTASFSGHTSSFSSHSISSHTPSFSSHSIPTPSFSSSYSSHTPSFTPSFSSHTPSFSLSSSHAPSFGGGGFGGGHSSLSSLSDIYSSSSSGSSFASRLSEHFSNPLGLDLHHESVGPVGPLPMPKTFKASYEDACRDKYLGLPTGTSSPSSSAPAPKPTPAPAPQRKSSFSDLFREFKSKDKETGRESGDSAPKPTPAPAPQPEPYKPSFGEILRLAFGGKKQENSFFSKLFEKPLEKPAPQPAPAPTPQANEAKGESSGNFVKDYFKSKKAENSKPPAPQQKPSFHDEDEYNKSPAPAPKPTPVANPLPSAKSAAHPLPSTKSVAHPLPTLPERKTTVDAKPMADSGNTGKSNNNPPSRTVITDPFGNPIRLASNAKPAPTTLPILGERQVTTSSSATKPETKPGTTTAPTLTKSQETVYTNSTQTPAQTSNGTNPSQLGSYTNPAPTSKNINLSKLDSYTTSELSQVVKELYKNNMTGNNFAGKEILAEIDERTRREALKKTVDVVKKTAEKAVEVIKEHGPAVLNAAKNVTAATVVGLAVGGPAGAVVGTGVGLAGNLPMENGAKIAKEMAAASSSSSTTPTFGNTGGIESIGGLGAGMVIPANFATGGSNIKPATTEGENPTMLQAASEFFKDISHHWKEAKIAARGGLTQEQDDKWFSSDFPIHDACIYIGANLDQSREELARVGALISKGLVQVRDKLAFEMLMLSNGVNEKCKELSQDYPRLAKFFDVAINTTGRAAEAKIIVDALKVHPVAGIATAAVLFSVEYYLGKKGIPAVRASGAEYAKSLSEDPAEQAKLMAGMDFAITSTLNALNITGSTKILKGSGTIPPEMQTFFSKIEKPFTGTVEITEAQLADIGLKVLVPVKKPVENTNMLTGENIGGGSKPKVIEKFSEQQKLATENQKITKKNLTPEELKAEASNLDKAPYNSRTAESMLKTNNPEANVTSTTLPRENQSNVQKAGQSVERKVITNPETGDFVIQKIVFDQKGFPILDQYTKIDLRISGDLGNMDRGAHMRAATRQLRDDIVSGKVNRDIFTKAQLEDIMAGKDKIKDHTWHHHQDVGRMQLVPEDIHELVGHIGGFDLWGKKK